jgi:hypothetical protein
MERFWLEQSEKQQKAQRSVTPPPQATYVLLTEW